MVTQLDCDSLHVWLDRVSRTAMAELEAFTAPALRLLDGLLRQNFNIRRE